MGKYKTCLECIALLRNHQKHNFCCFLSWDGRKVRSKGLRAVALTPWSSEGVQFKTVLTVLFNTYRND